MYKVLILLVIFLAVIYVYSFIKIRKNKEKTNQMNSVQDFHNNYQHLMDNGQNKKRNCGNNGYSKYVTKYNSSEDYREKR